eukprot:110128_1
MIMDYVVCSHVLLFISYSYTLQQPYYLSSNLLTYHHAELFCNVRCSSHLASIHNAMDYNHSITIITNNISITGVIPLFENRNIWIGLNDIKHEGHYTWTDHSIFDFGANISGGQYPWKYNSPNNANANDGGQHCVQYTFHWDYLWDDTECDNLDKVLCNACDSIIHRYIIIHQRLYWNEAHEYCVTHVGGHLATIYSPHHYKEAMFLCNKNQNDNVCWIGYRSLHTDTHRETIRYEINATIGDASTETDDDRRFFICDTQSEVDVPSQWLVIDGMWNSSNIMAVISGKQWINTNGKLVIEYMYRMNECSGDCEIGILIFNHNSLCSGSYIGISYSDQIYLSKWEMYGTQLKDLERVKLNFTLNTLWSAVLLRIEIINHTTYVILVNNVQYMVYRVVHSNETVHADNALSGYIGIRRVGITVESESLYISGSKISMNGTGIMQCPIESYEEVSFIRATWEGWLVSCIIIGIACIIVCIACVNENKKSAKVCGTKCDD